MMKKLFLAAAMAAALTASVSFGSMAGERYEIRSQYTGDPVHTVFYGDDAALEKLSEDVFYEEVADLSDEKTPDGEYIVMSFDGGRVQFRFFPGEGLENDIREVRRMDDGKKLETLYRADFRNPDRTCAQIMKEWIEEIRSIDEGVVYETDEEAY